MPSKAQLQAFKARVSPSAAAVLELRLPCRTCGKLTAGEAFLSLGHMGGTRVKGLKSIEAELPLCESCRSSS